MFPSSSMFDVNRGFCGVNRMGVPTDCVIIAPIALLYACPQRKVRIRLAIPQTSLAN